MADPSGLNSQPASLVRYLFRVPGWRESLFLAVSLSALAGVAVFETGSYADELLRGLVLFGLPAAAAGLTTSPVANRIGGRMTLDRSAFLALLAVTLVWITSEVGGLFRLRGQDLAMEGLTVGIGAALAIRLVVLMALSDRRFWHSTIPASLQSLYSVAVLPLFVTDPMLIAQSAGSVVLFAVLSYLFVLYLDAPMRRSFGVSGLDLLRAFMIYRHEGRKEEMENLLSRMGETVSVPVTTLAFRRPGGGIKGVFITSFLHPGPVGEIGGGNLPFRIAKEVEERFGGTAMVFHGAATHDLNMVSGSETGKAVGAAERAVEEAEFSGEAGESVRREGEKSKILAQRFGDGVFLASTNYPEPTEDLEFSIGYSAVAEAKSRGLREAMFVDSHNQHGQVPATYLGSAMSYDIIQTCSEATDAASEAESGDPRLGLAQTDLDYPDVGQLGLRVAVLEVGDQRTGFVLVDSNNAVEGLREKLLRPLDLDEAEFMTTDNHVVNMYGDNPVGSATPHDLLAEKTERLVDEAVEDLEPVEAGMESELAKNVKVFGSNRTSQIATTLNAVLAAGKGMFAAYIALAVAFTLLAFLAI